MQVYVQLILLCVGLMAIFATAQQGTAEETRAFKHPLTDMPGAADDIETTPYFPNHADHKLPIGEVVTTLCHLTNTGSSYYNVSAIMGSLNAPFDFNHHFQNYSYKPIGMVVKGGEEISLKYSFQLHPDLEPVEYQLAITVFYESESESFSTTFFNQTVELYSTASEYDFETIVLLLQSLATTTFVALVAIFACFPDTGVSKKITKVLKKVAPKMMEQPGHVAVDYDSSDEDHHEEEKKQARKTRKAHRE